MTTRRSFLTMLLALVLPKRKPPVFRVSVNDTSNQMALLEKLMQDGQLEFGKVTALKEYPFPDFLETMPMEKWML